MSIAYQQRRKWMQSQKKRSLRFEQARLMGEVEQLQPFAVSWLMINKRGILGRLKWALFKR